MKTVFTIILCMCFSLVTFAQKEIQISNDITVTKLSDKVYLYISVAEIGEWGKVPSNGLVIVNGKKAALLDTPMDNAQTETLMNWIKNTLKVKVTTFIPNHWHADCIGGLECLQKEGVKSYANQMTIDLAKANGRPAMEYGFKDSLTVKLGDMKLECYYPGAGHSIDNIVVWIPSEKILFGGCLVKDANAIGLGNITDGDVKAWPHTINKLLKKYSSAHYVIPGHGNYGGTELLTHTLELLK